MPDYTVDQINERIQSDDDMKQLLQDDPTEFKVRATQIYNNFGFNADGSPMRAAKKAIHGISKASGIPEGVVQGVAAAPLEIAGSMGGMALGARGGPKGALVGASAGSVLGSAANSLLGISEPMTPVDLGIAASSPFGGTVIAHSGRGAVKLAKRLLPGGGAGMNDLAAEQFANKVKSMRVTQTHVDDARDMMGLVQDFQVPITNLQQLFANESKNVGGQSLLGVPGKAGYFKELNNVIESNPELNSLLKGSTMSFSKLLNLEKGFNSIKQDRPGELWAKASGVIISAIEDMAKNPKLATATKEKSAEGLDAFKKFIMLNNKFKADDTMVKAFTPGAPGGVVKNVQGDNSMVLFDQNAFKKFLNNTPEITKAFSKEEIASMADSVKQLGYISKPPSDSSNAVNLAKRYGAGGMLGYLATGGNPLGAFAGAGIEEVIRKGVTSDPGRRMMKYLAAQGRGKIDGLELDTALGKIISGASTATVPGVTGRGSQPDMPQPFANQE